MVTDALNIREYTMIWLKNPTPGNLYFASGYAHREAITMCPMDPTTTTHRELNRDLVTGTTVLASTLKKSR